MFRNALYYSLKPLVPYSLRMAVRRRLAQRRRRQVGDMWPILPGSERRPPNWPGWPDGKKFAFILTHDVESQRGLARTLQLMALEKELGFRSSFNFIPRGTYEVPVELRERLKAEGFEVGVHDLKHDGKLFRSRRLFKDHATSINQYLREWGAVGFRSGFMMNELRWLHDLDISYDASTFDTDPFEPQPVGAETIFPFFVSPSADSADGDGNTGRKEGYVELPYTVPQDSTLFLIFQEKNDSVWKEKLQWIARHGGMVLMNTHPDYMNFEGAGIPGREFDASLYLQFLAHVRERYAGEYWHALPREVASRVRAHRQQNNQPTRPVSAESSTI